MSMYEPSEPVISDGQELPEMVDVIVVGAGAAGCVVASRLSEDPNCIVLLLESGHATPDDVTRIPGRTLELWSGDRVYENQTLPQAELAHRRVSLLSGRGVGGGSAINAMGWFQGLPTDYNGWRDRGAPGWGWSDIRSYLRRIEDHELGADAHHGSGGPMIITAPRYLDPVASAFVRACVEVGLKTNADLNGERREGVGVVQSNIRDGARHSVVQGYLDPAEARPNLLLRTGRRVDSVTMVQRRAVGVACGTTEVRAGRAVVLTAGALRTPQLLMLSGIGPQAQLREHGIKPVVDLPGVGANLHDHPLVRAVWPITEADNDARASLRAVDEYRQLHRGPLSSFGQAMAVARSDANLPAPDLHLTVTTSRPAKVEDSTQPSASCVVALLTPASRGSVRLASADPEVPPLIDPRYLEVPQDRHCLRAGLELAHRIFDEGPLAAMTMSSTSPAANSWDDGAALDRYIANTAGPYWHPVGTARLGTDRQAVVDLELAVHGVEGLFVADGSVIPTIPRANTQAPIIAIAERAAEFVSRHP